MSRFMYAIKDDLAAEFSFFGDYVNDEVAKRAFKSLSNRSEIPVLDFSLYKICEFNTKNGEVKPITPEFIMRGERDV